MSVPYQVVEAPIGPGIDEKTHPSKVELGKLLRGENFVFNKNGTLSKRYGSQAVSSDLLTGGTLPNPELLSTREDEIIAVSHNQIASRTVEYNRWMIKDDVSECFGFDKKLFSPANDFRDPNIAYYDGTPQGVGGVFIVAYQVIIADTNTHDVFAFIIDETTDAFLMSPVKLNSADAEFAQPRIIVVGDYAIVAYRIGNTVRARNINLTNPIAWGAETILVNDVVPSTALGLSGKFDINVILNNTTEFCFAYERNVAAPRITLHRFNAATLVSAATGVLASADVDLIGLAICADQNSVFWVGYSINAGTFITGANPVTLVTNVPRSLVYVNPTLGLGLCNRTNTTCLFSFTEFVQVAGSHNSLRALLSTVNTAGAVVNLRTSIHTVTASRPFMVGDEGYIYLYSSLNTTIDLQGTLFLCNTHTQNAALGFRTLHPVCTINPRQAYPADFISYVTSRFASAAAYVSVDKNSRYHTNAIMGYSNSSSTRLWMSNSYVDFDTSRRQSAELGRITYYTGGVPSYFDGLTCGEVSYLQYPLISRLTPAAGGAMTLLGTYSYVANYFYIDAHGNRHRSQPSVPLQVVLTVANQSVDIVIKCTSLTTRQEFQTTSLPIGIEIWRTTNAGTVYRRIIESNLPTDMMNNIINFVITHNDGVSDGIISDNEILFTTGGELGSVCPPSSQCLTVHKRRVWYGANKTVWYSTQHVEDEAPAFNDELTILIDEGGPITALASLDDKLIIFKEDRMFILYGDGPNDLGQQSDFTDPQRLSSNVGCINPRSVVFTPLGLFFQSKRGIYLLARNLEISYIGQFVENELLNYPVVNSATLHPQDTEVRFICSTASKTASIELRYDFRVNQWSTSVYREPVLGLPYYIPSTVNHAGSHVWCTGNTVNYENRTNYLDNGGYVSMFLEFAPLSAQGTQGYQSVSQVLLNCERKSPHDMTVQLDIDSGIYAQTKTWANADLAVLPKEQLEVHLGKVKNQSLIVRMVDTEPAIVVPSLGTGEGYSMIGLTYRVGPNDGPQKLIQGARK